MFVLDTNMFIYHAAGDAGVADFVESNIANNEQLIIPAICLVEFLSHSKLLPGEKQSFLSLVKHFQILPLDAENAFVSAELRLSYKLNVVDSIVSAAALTQKAVLVSRDKDFKKVKEIEVIDL